MHVFLLFSLFRVLPRDILDLFDEAFAGYILGGALKDVCGVYCRVVQGVLCLSIILQVWFWMILGLWICCCGQDSEKVEA